MGTEMEVAGGQGTWGGAVQGGDDKRLPVGVAALRTCEPWMSLFHMALARGVRRNPVMTAVIAHTARLTTQPPQTGSSPGRRWAWLGWAGPSGSSMVAAKMYFSCNKIFFFLKTKSLLYLLLSVAVSTGSRSQSCPEDPGRHH